MTVTACCVFPRTSKRKATMILYGYSNGFLQAKIQILKRLIHLPPISLVRANLISAKPVFHFALIIPKRTSEHAQIERGL